MTTRHDHWIGGAAVPPVSGTYLSTFVPTTRTAGDGIAAGSAPDVDRAVAAARAAQPIWAARSAAERADALAAVADAVATDAEALVELERTTTGKTVAQARTEVDTSIAYLRYYAGVVRSHHGRTIDLGAGAHAYTRREPYGVVAIITPWNLPLNQTCRAVAPALAVGNAVVTKPSEFTSLSTLLLARIASAAGLPDGLLSVVTGTGPDVGEPLVAHPDVRRIAFTGSVATGRRLAHVAADRLVPLTLELGGKSPVVVFADADLDRAAVAAASAASMNAGQVCSATTRIVVEESAHDDLVARVVAILERLRPGVDLGPIITQAQFEKVRDHLARARAAGLVPVTGGDVYADGPGARGQYVQPTLFARVDPALPIARDEVFGPVLVTLPFPDGDEAAAVAVANDTEFGLVGSVWSGDLARGLRVAERIDAGQVAVNGGPLTVETPFGGVKQSGYGREKGLEAMDDYSWTKTVSLGLGGS